MQEKDLIELVNKIQTVCSESQTIEVKEANKGCPKRLYDTLSSFSNQDDGGIIIFGLDEKQNFAATGVYDVQDLQKQVNNQCKEMEPIIRPLITTAEINGFTVMSAEIPPIEVINRPCYYKGKGKLRGSYVRAGESDEPMTDYEIYSYEAFRQKYQDDIRPIERATKDTLDSDSLNEFKRACKKNKPHLSKISDEHQFEELMSITRDGKITLSSVLLFGIYPQAYFPQLSVIATVIPGTEDGVCGENNERFLDNKRIEGTISDILDSTLQFVRTNTRTSTIIDPETGKRIDKTEYPTTAVREIILNALVHRDYSIHTEGMPIQVKIYNDRLEIKNPGGLYGRLRIDQLGKMQPDTRNPVLATAMEILNLTENRYSGIPTILSEMKNAALPAPIFSDERGTFTVTLYKKSSPGQNNDTSQQAILDFCLIPRTRIELAEFLGVTTPSYAIKKYIKPLIESHKIGLTNPDRPNSPTQKYFTL